MLVNSIKRFDNYVDSLIPRWMRDSLIIFIISFFSFYYFYSEIQPKWRFFGTSIISIASIIIVSFVVSLLATAFSNRMTKLLLEEAYLEVGVNINSASEEDIKKYKTHLINKYSSEKLVNRVTDAIGIIMFIISIPIQVIIPISMIVMVFYFSLNGYYSDDWILWVPVLCGFILYSFISLVFFCCKVLFNRYPCEAKMYNRWLRKTKG